MASTTIPTYMPKSFDFGAFFARVHGYMQRLPLGEERFTVSAHQARVSDNGPRESRPNATYRPTYALQIV